MRMDHLTRLYELKDKDVQEMIKHFSSVLKTIIKSLNVSVTEDIESLIVEYNKSIEMVRSPMVHFDVYTFLPHLRSHKDYLRPLILYSGGRNAGIFLFHNTWGINVLWRTHTDKISISKDRIIIEINE